MATKKKAVAKKAPARKAAAKKTPAKRAKGLGEAPQGGTMEPRATRKGNVLEFRGCHAATNLEPLRTLPGFKSLRNLTGSNDFDVVFDTAKNADDAVNVLCTNSLDGLDICDFIDADAMEWHGGEGMLELAMKMED